MLFPDAIWTRLKAFLAAGEVGTITLEVGLPGRVTGASFNGETLMPGDEKLARMVRGIVLDTLRDVGVPVQPKPPKPAPASPAPPAPPPSAAK